MPKKIDTFIEPFAGSASVSVALHAEGRAKRFILGDASPLIANLHAVLADPCLFADVCGELTQLVEQYEHADAPKQEELFYAARRLLNTQSVSATSKAAFLIFLNHTTYNGLMRVNSAGLFNSPWGKRAKAGGCVMKLEGCREFYKRVLTLSCEGMDFESFFDKVLVYMDSGAVVYCDPPYCGTFDGYTTAKFSADDHARLAIACGYLRDISVPVFISNSDTPEVRKLYEDFTIVPILGRSCVSQDSDERGAVKELLIYG